MEFVLVSRHTGRSVAEKLKSIEFLSVPDAFLVYLGVATIEEYTRGIVHVAQVIDFEEVTRLLIERRYVRLGGTCVWRHPTTMRTAILHYNNEEVLLSIEEPMDTINISKISYIAWQDSDELPRWLGVLEARIKVKDVIYRETTREGVGFVAVPLMQLESIPHTLRDSLRFLKCRFDINVSFPSGSLTGERKVHRCLEIPSSLINMEHVPTHVGEYWSILHIPAIPVSLLTTPSPQMVVLSDTLRRDLRIDNKDKRDFVALIQSFHTATEAKRIEMEVMPRFFALATGESCRERVEFVKPIPRFMSIVGYRMRSILLLTFCLDES